jgi:hypothetical protein
MKASLLLTAILSTALAGEPGTTPYDPDSEHSLGGIVIGQEEVSVIAALGPPRQRNNNVDGALPIELSYNGLVVYLDEQGVGGIVSTSQRFCTPSKVCPGMTIDRVQQIYGAPVSTTRGHTTLLQYFLNDGCWIQLAANKNVISSIEVLCSP